MRMAKIERVTITMPTEMASAVRDAVEQGGYASTSEVVREALRDWSAKRTAQQRELAALKADIAQGLADLEAGRTMPVDAQRIAARGRKLLVRG